jgi:hypothetical protein
LSSLPVLARGLTAGFAPEVWDWYVDESGRADFSLSLAEGLSVQVDAGSDTLDTVLTVFDADGNLLFENDDHPEVIGSNSRVVERLEAGEYCVSVRGFAGAGGEFAVSVAMPGEGPDLGGGAGGGFGGAADPTVCTAPGTVDLAAGLAPGFAAVALPGLVGADGPADFRLSASAAVELQLDAASDQIDTVMTLYTADGTYLSENDDDFEAGGTNSRILTTLDAGSYCLRVRSFGGESGPFTVAVAAPGSAAPMPEAPELVLPETFEELGVLADAPLATLGLTTDRVLWAAFEVAEAGPVSVQGVSLDGPFMLTLLSEDGTEVAAQSSTGDVNNTTIQSDVGPGRYLVALAYPFDFGWLGVRQITVSRP